MVCGIKKRSRLSTVCITPTPRRCPRYALPRTLVLCLYVDIDQDEFQHARKTKAIVDSVLRAMDKDGDELVSLEEFETAGIEALPNFDDLGAHGHHYDVESGAYT